MIPLFAVEATTPPPVPDASGGRVERCRRCRRPLKDPESLGFHIGPKCREHLGITPSRRPVRVGGVRVWPYVEGQGDLLRLDGEQEEAEQP